MRPSVEGRGGAQRIDPASMQRATALCGMFSRVAENICQGILGFAWCLQNASVESIAKHCPAALHDRVDPLRNPNAEALRSARKRIIRIRLDDQVQMIPHRRELDDSKSLPFVPTKRLPHDGEGPRPAQIPDMWQHLHRDQRRRMSIHPLPPMMRDARTRT